MEWGIGQILALYAAVLISSELVIFLFYSILIPRFFYILLIVDIVQPFFFFDILRFSANRPLKMGHLMSKLVLTQKLHLLLSSLQSHLARMNMATLKKTQLMIL